MKTILVATDFSKNSDNALKYAIDLAKWKNAKLILFHAYFLPVIPGEIPVQYALEEIQNDAILQLKKIADHIHTAHKDLQVEVQCRPGVATVKILECAERNKVDLVVMGLRGTGYIAEKLIGSITTSLIQQSHIPILVINDKIKFKPIQRIALAFDYTEIKADHMLPLLKDLSSGEDSKIYVFNVVKSELQATSSVTKAVEGMKLSRSIGGMPHSFHYSEDEDIIHGINHFVKDQKIELLVMVPREHTPLYKLFNEPQTKRMAFHTSIPLLTIKE
ncbi:MAG TPA: universal stress protein [Bacteroidia bacterium]|nr:universal stress protein [Bacteroidia bacterium]